MRFALGTFVALLLMLSTATIGSVHIALADNHKFTRDFSNSGNNQEKTPASGNVSISTTRAASDKRTLNPNEESNQFVPCTSGSVTGGGWSASAASGGAPSVDVIINGQDVMDGWLT